MEFDPYLNPQDDNTYAYYRALRQAGDVIPAKHIGNWCFTGYQVIAAALKDTKHFSSSAWSDARDRVPEIEALGIPDSLISLDPPTHTRMRRIVGQAFGSKHISTYRPWLETLAEDLLATACSLGSPTSCDFISDFAIPFPISVIGQILGVDPQMKQTFKQWSCDIIHGQTVAFMEESPERDELLARVVRSNHDLRDYLVSLAQERRQKPENDLITKIVQADWEGSLLSDLEVASFGMLLLVAGNETTTNLLGNSIRALDRFPKMLLTLRANLHDDEFIFRLVNELLRFDSPAQGVFRTVKEDIVVDNKLLKEGDRVVLLLGSANHDERIFSNPEELLLDRDAPHLSFGAGVHTCLGKHLAELEAVIGLKAFFTMVSDFSLENYSFTQSPFLRGNDSLRLKLARFGYQANQDLSRTALNQ